MEKSFYSSKLEFLSVHAFKGTVVGQGQMNMMAARGQVKNSGCRDCAHKP